MKTNSVPTGQTCTITELSQLSLATERCSDTEMENAQLRAVHDVHHYDDGGGRREHLTCSVVESFVVDCLDRLLPK
jgi:hypothetical protein